MGVSRPAPDATASRRTVTVLFSDLTGSTSLGERMDPESVRALMAPIYAAMRSEVETRGGHVSKFVGDGVMAVFGIPEVREDDAMRALDSAVGMQQALDRLAADVAREHGAILQLKVGVNTGEIVVGAGDEDIVGDCVNVASRLEGAAAPGEILVGEDTWRLTRSMATYEPVAPLTLKGKSGPVPAYRLVSLEQTTEARIATFVGRDAELARLLDVFEETVAASASRLVSIVGSPGLGKTRLARELGAALDERALVVETRCDPGGSATFAPVADALRTAAGIAETATPDEVTAAIAALVPDEPDRDRIVARAAALLGTGEPGSTEETFWAIRRIVEVAARVLPMVLVLDDLHWGEPLMLDLVEHLAEWNRSAPVLLVVTGRPELRQIRPALTEGGRASAVISLEGLDGEATGALACGLLGTDRVPPELLARLPESTEGNPLFVREFVRMLVDEGVLRRSDGAWAMTVDVDAIQVPPTIQSLLSARVDRLDPAERTVLELASVVGKEFYRGAVHHLAPAAVRVSLDAHLESLRRKEFVEPAGTYWIDEPVFRFHHVLIRDAAYRRLLKEARADLHERVAAWLEAKTAEVLGEHDELIGFHYEQAHESLRQLKSPGAGRDEHAQELERKAALRLSAAARSALDRDDIPAAAALSRRALERLDFDNPDRAQILIVHCEALLAVGDLDAANDPIQELEHLAEVASDKRLKAWATCFEYEWRSLVVPSRLPELEERIGVAIDDLRSAGDQAGVAKAYTVHATVLASLGRVTECEVALDAALNAAREAGDRRRITDVLSRAMTAALWGPSPVARAGGRCLDLVRLSRITTNPPEIESTSLRCQAVLEAFRGRADAARRQLRSARRSLEELGRPYGILQNELFAGIVELVDEKPADAVDHLRAAYEGLRAMGVRAHAARAAALLARAHLVLGDEDEAFDLTEKSERLGGADLKAAMAWRGVRAEILGRRGEHGAARRLAQAAVDLAPGTDALVDLGDAWKALAAVWSAAGDETAARRAADQAASLYGRKGAIALGGEPPSPSGRETASRTYVSFALENQCTRVSAELVARWRKRESFEGLVVDGYVTDDRRRGIRTTTTGAQGTGAIGVRRIVGRAIATRGERLALFDVSFLHDGDDPGAFRTDHLMIQRLDPGGRLDLRINFDSEDLDVAIDELDERFLAGEGAPFADTYRPSVALARARNTRDWEAYRRLVAEDAVVVDRRGASLGELRGVDAMVSASRELDELIGDTKAIVASVVAIRDGAFVSQVVYAGSGDGGGEVEIGYCSVLEIEGGRVVRQERFPPERLDLALARFEELGGREVPAAPSNLCAEVVRRVVELFHARDWSGFGSIHAEDTVWEDRRPGFATTLVGREAVMENWRAIGRYPDLRADTELVATRGERLCLTRQVFGNDDPDATYEVENLWVTEITDDGSIGWRAAYDPADLESAMAELDERFRRLEEPSTSRAVWWNRCVEVYAAWRSAFLERDWGRMTNLFAEDVSFEDRRAGLRVRQVGRDAILEQTRIIADLGANEVEFTPVATRGERLALVHSSYAATEGETRFEAEALELVAIDGEGRACGNTFFDVGDLDAAIEELDERYLADGGAGFGGTYRIGQEIVRATNAADWTAIRNLLSDDFVMIDHQPASLGEIRGADELVEAVRQLHEVAPDMRLYVAALPIIREVAAVALLVNRSSVSDSEIGYWSVTIVRDGLMASQERFPPDRLDLALARFGELCDNHPTRALTLENLCTRAWTRFGQALIRRDWVEVAEAYSENLVYEDRRRGLRDRRVGRRAQLEQLKAAADAGAARFEGVVVAVRGDRLALHRNIIRGKDAGGFEVETLSVHELEPGDGFVADIVFDADDLDAALDELDARYVAGEGAPYTSAVEFARRGLRAMNERDWDAYRSLLHDDMVLVDHRPASLGEIHDADEYVRTSRALVDVVPNLRFVLAQVHAIEGDRALVLMSARGRAVDGDEIDMSYNGIFEFPGGRISRMEGFRVEDVDLALARFHELSRARHDRSLENDAVRALARCAEAFAARDWERFGLAFAPDVLGEDRRWGLLADVVGRAGVLENMRAAAAVGAAGLEHFPVATRGDRLVLGKLRYWTPPEAGGYEVEILQVTEVEESGMISRFEIFDPDDLDPAFDALDDRYVAGEGQPYEVIVRAVAAVRHARSTGDDAAFRAALADDFVVVDHRPTSFGTRTGDEWIESWRVMDELATVRWDVAEIHAIDPEMAVVYLVVAGHTPGGAEVQFDNVSIVACRRGLLSHSEIFLPEQLDTALARFEELRRRTSEPLGFDTSAIRLLRRILDAFARRDWEALGDCAREDVVVIDRRMGFGSTLEGRRAAVENFRVIAQMGAVEFVAVPLAVRGDKLLLARQRFVLEGFETELLAVGENDDEGRGLRMVFFDPDDLDAAYNELDERYLAGEGADHVEIVRLLIDLVRLHTERDWTRFASLVADGFVLTDHRPASLGRIVGRDAWLESHLALLEMVSDHRMRVAFARFQGPVLIGRVELSGTNIEGGPVEQVMYQVASVRDGKVASIDIFPVDEYEAALVRFFELTD